MAEVILDKQADGSWQAPKRQPKAQSFPPWKRLWLVTGCVYLLLLIGTCWLVVPSQDRVERRMVAAVAEELRRYDGMALAGESPDGILQRARSAGYDAWIRQLRFQYRIGVEGDAGFNRIERQFREELDSLPTKQLVAALIATIAWIVPMAMLYAIGFTIDWIKRGARGLQQ